MLSRFISRTPSHLRFLTLISSNPSISSSLPPTTSQPSLSHPLLQNPKLNFFFETSRCFSSNRKSKGNDSSKDPSISNSWKISTDNDNDGDSIFKNEDGNFSGFTDGNNGDFNDGSELNDDSWGKVSSGTGDIFEHVDNEFGSKKSSTAGDDDWATVEGYKPWSFADEEKNVFDLGERNHEQPSERDEAVERETTDADNLLEEKKVLSLQLKGPNRAFGDLIAASGITDEMLDSLILLKDLKGVDGLPPLSEIEDMRLEKSERKSTNAEIERKKQEEIAKARVRQVDEKGRAYGTGRRKCSIARVWVQPGDGKFSINDKSFDVYFPLLDHRAALLRPFSETKTLGLWDVNCTVKGGGLSGQVGAIQLGISRALQNWEPGLRPYLRAEGFLTRDSRVVERKKPGKAKARKSFQWVKR